MLSISFSKQRIQQGVLEPRIALCTLAGYAYGFRDIRLGTAMAKALSVLHDYTHFLKIPFHSHLDKLSFVRDQSSHVE